MNKSLTKSDKIFIIVFTIILLLYAVLIILTPNFKLLGDKYMDIQVNTNYEEYGTSASIFFNKNKLEVETTGKVDTTKLGTYEITYDIKNYFIKREIKRIVNVVDTITPKLEIGPKELVLCPNEIIKKDKLKSIDNYDGDITDDIIIDEKNHFINYKSIDSSGNSTQKQAKLKRVDNEKPSLNLNGNSIVYIQTNTKYIEPGYTSIDNCDGDITNKVEIVNNVNSSSPGTYKITYKVKDQSNNESLKERTVVVYNSLRYSNNGPAKNGTIYLTFDDGPSYSSTPIVLNILKKKNVKATFFVVNKSDNLNYLIQRENNEGHVVAIHGSSHQYSYIYSSVDNFLSDFKIMENKVYNLTGQKSMVMRFPGGSSNTVSKNYSKGIMTYLANYMTSLGYNYFDWNVSSGDAGTTTSDRIYSAVVNNLSHYRSNVVLMHDFENNYKTTNVLEQIIDYGISNGYAFDVLTKDTYPVRHGISN